jgi:O-antigen/teichoic acid export membrane protein
VVRSVLSVLRGQGTEQGRATVVVLDQVVSSGTNFLVAIMVARALGPAGFGVYTFAFAVWVVFMSLLRTLVVQPFTIEVANLPDARQRDVISAGATASLLLGGFAAVAVSVGAHVWTGQESDLRHALLSLVLVMPALHLQDYWRFVGFATGAPARSLWNDLMWAGASGAALVAVLVFKVASPSSAVLAWGTGAVVGALAGGGQFSVRLAPLGRAVHWTRGAFVIGRWFAASSVTASIAAQAVNAIILGLLGPAALGGLRSVLNLFSPAQMLAGGLEAATLPRGARAFTSTGWVGLLRVALGLSGFLAIGAAAIVLLVQLGGEAVLAFVFGPDFVGYRSLILPIGASVVFSLILAGGELALRAAKAGRSLVHTQVPNALFRVGVVWVSAVSWGIQGVAWAWAIASMAHALSVWIEVARSSRMRLPSMERFP